MEFTEELYKVKALTIVDEKIVHGYYYKNVCHYVDVPNENFEEKLEHPIKTFEINPYTICRNTGIKINNSYLYEFDLIEYSNGVSRPEVGFVEWDNFNNRYSIRSSLNYKGRREMKSYKINIIGNMVLMDDDYTKMQKYSDKTDAIVSSPEPECRSKQRLNKLAKQHLPR